MGPKSLVPSLKETLCQFLGLLRNPRWRRCSGLRPGNANWRGQYSVREWWQWGVFGDGTDVLISDGALVEGNRVRIGPVNFMGSEPGDVVINDSTIRSRDSSLEIGGFRGDNGDDLPRIRLTNSRVESTGMGPILIAGQGGGQDAIVATRSIIDGFNTALIAGPGNFTPANTTDNLVLSDATVVSSDPSGRLQIFVPSESNLQVDNTSSVGSIFGNQLLKTICCATRRELGQTRIFLPISYCSRNLIN